MNRYKYLYLFWLLPASFLFLILHQTIVYNGLIDTYTNGKSYSAEVVSFNFKQVAAQTNGHIVLRFTDEDGSKIDKSLSLPVEMAGQLQKIRVVPIRYQPGNFQEVVIMPTYKTQKDLVWTNIAMACVGFLITFFIALYAHRFAGKKLSEGDEKIIIERVD